MGVAQIALTTWLMENDHFPPKAYRGHNEKTVSGLRIGRFMRKHKTQWRVRTDTVVLAMAKDA